MPRINPAIMIWARETAGFSQEEAARQLGFRNSPRSSAVEKLARIEQGQKEPSRSQLIKMAGQYRRPLLTFYLSRPPQTGKRGVDFRTLPRRNHCSDEARLDALIREIRARQSMVRVMLEEEDEGEALAFVGSHRIEDGSPAVLESLQVLLGLEAADYRARSDASAAFNLLRGNAEDAGIYVLLKGDLGNYRTALDTTVFRGFSIADEVAPFVVINDQDARPAWSFTPVARNRASSARSYRDQRKHCGKRGRAVLQRCCRGVPAACKGTEATHSRRSSRYPRHLGTNHSVCEPV